MSSLSRRFRRRHTKPHQDDPGLTPEEFTQLDDTCLKLYGRHAWQCTDAELSTACAAVVDQLDAERARVISDADQLQALHDDLGCPCKPAVSYHELDDGTPDYTTARALHDPTCARHQPNPEGTHQ